MSTSSLWGAPPLRYYRLLQLVEASLPARPLSIAILGCSDGKFVLPAARRGHRVLAIDVDRVALFGGEKSGAGGTVFMPGLVARLREEGLDDLVEVVAADMVDYSRLGRLVDLAFTSGSIQYARNLRYSANDIMASIKSFVCEDGYLCIEYMLPVEDEHHGRDNFFLPGVMRGYFCAEEWTILRDHVLPPVLQQAHVDSPTKHRHHWGLLLARRTRGDKKSRESD